MPTETSNLGARNRIPQLPAANSNQAGASEIPSSSKGNHQDYQVETNLVSVGRTAKCFKASHRRSAAAKHHSGGTSKVKPQASQVPLSNYVCTLGKKRKAAPTQNSMSSGATPTFPSVTSSPEFTAMVMANPSVVEVTSDAGRSRSSRGSVVSIHVLRATAKAARAEAAAAEADRILA